MGLLSLDLDITDDVIKKFITGLIGAKYQLGDCQLGESSQGLGYSNLIYIFMQIEKYKKSIDPLKVNFFIIEEPEAHMHPQMQTVFITELFNYYRKSNNTVQCLITTHSTEVVRGAKEISKLRVLRRSNQFTCSLFDLKKFRDSIANNNDLIEFYDFFFTINFPNIVFADKVLMYEGDTERMYISKLISLPEFYRLQQQYIAFVQVGGAYAFKYKELLEFLKIKTVIITDIDYKKTACDKNSILNSKVTNETIKKFAAQYLELNSPTVENLYGWQDSLDRKKKSDNLIYLAFQGKNDHYSRTLEEAMLSKFYKYNTFDEQKKEFWINSQKRDEFRYTIPRKKTLSIRDIVESTSKKKTDFMYSVLLKGKHKEMLPNYIEEALKWLAE
ncbi:ATP-dependent nuclease [Gilliamella sp. Gris1-4]|uniref:ATP-dependent nuclease n=1 Tax=Gilliamella sp. Gris1-4 TaxID=3120244 RepID=UPI00080E8AB8|nr:AAA family ATPase [Gilliamella apicola]OCG37884.1 hypothetical protein A9G31_03180 [Gilliamella apicola]OCG65876.1 hypothetical protein A9G39_08205 [Gilliamella apicola]